MLVENTLQIIFNMLCCALINKLLVVIVCNLSDIICWKIVSNE